VYSYGTSTNVMTIQKADGNVGIGQVSPGYKLDVTGDVRILSGSLGVGVAPNATDGRGDFSNDVVAYSTSDKRLKENIKPLDNALDKVLKISGVEFDWKELTEKEKKTIHSNKGHDVGVIAQEIEKVLPEVVTTRDNGYKAVKYEKIVPLLIEAIKEQQEQIDELRKGNFVIQTGD
jgi:multidrug efflux pump subunit AcrB